MVSKEAMLKQLHQFMYDRAVDVECWYGLRTGGLLVGHPNRSALNDVEPDDAHFEHTPMWQEFNAVYDYAVGGTRPIQGSPFTEEFCETVALELDLGRLPEHVAATVYLANARHVLDGGEREFLTHLPEQYLGFVEMAELAGMDERSVRNAANPKLPNSLATELHGKRTVVSVKEARRWLAGRKGFIPTKSDAPAVEQVTELTLPIFLVDKLKSKASAAQVSVEQFIGQILAGL